jgi:hypothetical protein
MLLNLTREQIEEIIKALEKEPNQVADKYSVLNYLKIAKQSEPARQRLDDIPF